MTPGNWNDLTHQTAPRLPTESSRLLLCRSCYSAPVLGEKQHKPEIMFLDCKQGDSLLLLTLAKNVVQADIKLVAGVGWLVVQKTWVAWWQTSEQKTWAAKKRASHNLLRWQRSFNSTHPHNNS